MTHYKTRICENCDEEFSPKSHNSKNCKKEIINNCLQCSKEIETICSTSESKKYCNPSCRNKYMRSKRYKISTTKICNICNNEYIPTSSKQRVCNLEHSKTCKFCNEEYTPITQKYFTESNKYCDNICSTLAQGDSRLNKDLVKEYKNPNQWALEFKKTSGRKPKKVEFLMYFGLRVPPFADMKLFEKTRDSKLELTVIHYLKSLGLEEGKDFLRRSRFNINDRWFELDLYFPELNIGFEVQDFDTHCREESGRLDKYGKPIKDKTYHKNKSSALIELDITVYELWEDEILSGGFEKNIHKMLALR